MLSPLVALRVSAWLQDRKELHNRRRWIFRTILVTRGATLSPDHVQALNSIAIDFRGRGTVIEAWKALLHHLGTPVSLEGWAYKKEELLRDLLLCMSKDLRYDFKPSDLLLTPPYVPVGHSSAFWEQEQIRKRFREVLDGTRAIPMLPIMPSQQPIGPPQQSQLPEDQPRRVTDGQGERGPGQS